MEILPRMLWILLPTSLGIPIRKIQKPGKGLWSSSRECKTPFYEDIADMKPALVLGLPGMGLPPRCNPLRRRMVNPTLL